MHESKSIFKKALARLPVVIPIWFLAIIFPFFGPINSTVGSLLVSFTVYIIPALAHMITFAPPAAREVKFYSASLCLISLCAQYPHSSVGNIYSFTRQRYFLIKIIYKCYSSNCYLLLLLLYFFLQNAVERPPSFLGGWAGMYSMNFFVVGWVLVVGFGFGGWASMLNFIQQVNTFGLFTKCYQCPHKN